MSCSHRKSSKTKPKKPKLPPPIAVRLIAQNVKYGCKFNIECSSKYIHNNNFNDNTTYNLEVEILRNLTDQRHGLLDTYAKERQIEGNMQYGKSYYKKAIKHYRNALGILGLHWGNLDEIVWILAAAIRV